MGRLRTRMMERDVSIILSPWVMVRGMRRRMDRSIGIDSVREGIVDSEIFGVLGCYLVVFIGNSSLGPALVLCLAKPITTSINNPFAFNNREQPHQHQKPTRWSLEEEEE